MTINIDVEYCGTCGYKNKFDELKEHVLKNCPDVNVNGFEGRRATFEVKINGELVHSKLSTMAFPDYDDVSSIVSEVSNGNSIRKAKQQPITNCAIV